MSMFTNCSGECCVCSASGGCLAGHGDDDFTPATKREIQRRIDAGEYSQYREYMINYLNNHQEADRVAQMKENINVQQLINRFRGMAKRGTLLTGPNVSQEDLLIQIEGTIVKVAMEGDK